MKRLLLILALLVAWPSMVHAQSSWPPPQILTVDPVGACVNGTTAYNIVADKIWGCVGNAWVQFSTGGGAGTVGPGTINKLSKFTAATAVGDSSVIDNGSNAVYSPEGIDVGLTGANCWQAPNNAVTGTGSQLAVCDDGSGTGAVETCPAASSATNFILGVATTGANGAAPGTTGNTAACTLGFIKWKADGTVTAGHFLQGSASVNGEATDVGATAPTNGQQYYFASTGCVGAGCAATVRIVTPSELSASQIGGGGKGTQVQVGGAKTKSIANLNNTTPAAGAGNVNVTWQKSDSGNTSSVSAEVPNTITVNGTTCTLGGSCSPSGAGTVQSKIPLEGCTPDTTGNVIPNIHALGYRIASWDFITNGTTPPVDLFCRIRVPHNFSANGKIVLDTYINDGTAGHTYSFKETDTIVSTTLNASLGVLSAAQTCTTTTTAYAPCTLTYSVVSTLTADSQLLIDIDLSAISGEAAPVILFPYFQWDGGL